MDRILVGMDGSESSVGALQWAVALARSTGASVTVVNAFAPMQSEKRPGFLERLRSQQEQELASWCGDLLDGVPSTTEVLDGDPRDVLPLATERFDADLLVVASEGSNRRGPGFLHIGSVVEFLAHHLDRPMAVITPDAPPTITTMVVGVDGSDHGRSAIAWTAEVAESTGAKVIALTVEEPGQPIVGATGAAGWQAAAEHTISTEWAARLAALGDRFRAVATEATRPADALASTAADAGADLIVVGARGLGGIAELRIGGTALSVLHRADRPVVFVPPAPAEG